MPTILYALLLVSTVAGAGLTWFFYRSDAAYDGDDEPASGDR